MAVPAGNAGDRAAEHFNETDGGVLRHIAEAFDGCYGFVESIFKCLQRFTHGVDHAITGGLRAALGAAAANRFAGEHAGGILTDQAGIFVHHPAHHLGGGANIRRGHVVAGSDVLPHGSHPAAADFFLFDIRQGGGVDRSRRLCRRPVGYRQPRISMSSMWRERGRCRRFRWGESGCLLCWGRARRCAGRETPGRHGSSHRPCGSGCGRNIPAWASATPRAHQ